MQLFATKVGTPAPSAGRHSVILDKKSIGASSSSPYNEAAGWPGQAAVWTGGERSIFYRPPFSLVSVGSGGGGMWPLPVKFTVQGTPLTHIQTCSTWTSLYRDPLGHVQTCSLWNTYKRVVGILLQCFLVCGMPPDKDITIVLNCDSDAIVTV